MQDTSYNCKKFFFDKFEKKLKKKLYSYSHIFFDFYTSQY